VNKDCRTLHALQRRFVDVLCNGSIRLSASADLILASDDPDGAVVLEMKRAGNP
jgi:hypothetical protein